MTKMKYLVIFSTLMLTGCAHKYIPSQKSELTQYNAQEVFAPPIVLQKNLNVLDGPAVMGAIAESGSFAQLYQETEWQKGVPPFKMVTKLSRKADPGLMGPILSLFTLGASPFNTNVNYTLDILVMRQGVSFKLYSSSAYYQEPYGFWNNYKPDTKAVVRQLLPSIVHQIVQDKALYAPETANSVKGL